MKRRPFPNPFVWTTGLTWILLLLAGAASAEHLAREDPPEPIFTQRAFIENDLETAIDWGRGFGTQDIEIGAGITWIVYDGVQFGAEIPLGIVIPDKGTAQADLSDIDFSAKWLFCCEEPTGYTFAAARIDVSPPTGNRKRDIGGTGSFGFSVVRMEGYVRQPISCETKSIVKIRDCSCVEIQETSQRGATG